MKIEQLDISEYNDGTEPHSFGHLVFQVVSEDCSQYQIQYPLPDRGGDAELDFDDGQIPCILFCAMLGRAVSDEEVIGKFFKVTLPTGVFNG